MSDPVKRRVVVSFPKSGRTWLRVMLDQLGIDAEFTHDGTGHNRPQSFTEWVCEPRHYADSALLFLLRDPCDTAVSGFHQKRDRLQGYPGSLSDFLRDPKHGIEKIVRFNLAWLEGGSTLPSFLATTYEALQEDTVGALTSVVRYWKYPCLAEQILKVVQDNTFERMQERERTGELGKVYGDRLRPRNVDNLDTYKVRRGQAGAFQVDFSEQDIQFARDIYSKYDYFRRAEVALASHGVKLNRYL